MNYEQNFIQFREKTKTFCRAVIYPITLCYAYFVVIGILTLTQERFSSTIALIYFLIFHLLLMYTTVFYIRIFPTEGVTTKDFFYPEAEESIGNDHINMFVAEKIKASVISRKSICSTCGVYKPPRAHHCKICNRCYLKMDHHCVIINECIGWHNYKFFVLFLFFNLLLSVYICGVLIYESLAGDLRRLLFVHYIICSSIFGIEFLICGTMLCYHGFLIWHNETTIENIAINSFKNNENDESAKKVFQEGVLADEMGQYGISLQDKDRRTLNPYNITPYINFSAVFGDDPTRWFLPTFSSNGNGVQFLKNLRNEEEEIAIN